MPRPSEIVDDRTNPKRRRLDNNCSKEARPYLQNTSALLDVRQECNHTINHDQAEEILSNNLPRLSNGGSEWNGRREENGEDRECCYGMLSEIHLRSRHSSSLSNIHSLPFTFRAPNLLVSPDDISLELELQSATYANILNTLNELDDIKLQLCCYSRLELPCQTTDQAFKRRKGKPHRVWLLNVILYGTVALGQVIGRYLSKNRAYLQDPVDCRRIVLYRNPHMIQDGDSIMTDAFTSSAPTVEIERITVGPDLLAQLMSEQTALPETEPSSLVTTPLFRHQKQALTFMMRREQGWNMEGNEDVWAKQEHHPGSYRYQNNVNGHLQHDPPPHFRGGLLADDMGLGKTLSMISLIATDQMSTTASSDYTTSQNMAAAYPRAKSTLLIVPPPLIQAWKKQFEMHVLPDNLKIHVDHGQNRKGVEYLLQHDVVITTYQTLSSAWKKQNSTRSLDTLFSVSWHRIILDEAHVIQNAQSQQARACCALQAESRWAITGTPIQNKLTDFASILKFLRVHPYSDHRVFDEEIARPWHQVNPDGFLRLKTLVRAITISRSKAVIDLPSRVDEIHHLDFSTEERDAYNSANKDTIALFEDAISSGRQGGKTFNALTRLNYLRLFCNLGLSTYFQQATVASSAPRANRKSPGLIHVPDPLLGDILDGSAACTQCGQVLLDDLLEGLPSLETEQLPCTKDVPKICVTCRSYSTTDQLPLSPPGQSGSPAGSLCLTPRDESFDFSTRDIMPTKIKTLVADLAQRCLEEKCVVFSFWTSTLDLTQQILKDEGIACTRIDGKTSLAKRSDAMNSFQTDDSIKVILVSITCGGAGLDLTAGSRVYLLEPHWNPMIEEQALCRVHRVGQRCNVTTVRYLMRNSFEEQVVEIQKRKKKLAEVTFGSGPLSENGIGIGTLKYLKSVLE